MIYVHSIQLSALGLEIQVVAQKMVVLMEKPGAYILVAEHRLVLHYLLPFMRFKLNTRLIFVIFVFTTLLF